MLLKANSDNPKGAPNSHQFLTIAAKKGANRIRKIHGILCSIAVISKTIRQAKKKQLIKTIKNNDTIRTTCDGSQIVTMNDDSRYWDCASAFIIMLTFSRVFKLHACLE